MNTKYLFIPSSDTHVDWMLPIAKKLPNSSFGIIASRNENADKALTLANEPFSEVDPNYIEATKPQLIILGSDWGREEKALIRKIQKLGGLSICIQEGPLEFKSWKYLRMVRSDISFFMGKASQKACRRKKNAIVTGCPKFDSIHEFPIPTQPKVLINSNFTYNINENWREPWLEMATDVCRELSLNSFISRHPRDSGKESFKTAEIESNARNIHFQLKDCSIIITRFSTLIFEALCMGRRVIYFNPHSEFIESITNEKFNVLIHARSKRELKESLNWARSAPITENEIQARSEFLKYHIGTINRDSVERCVNQLRILADTALEPKDLVSHFAYFLDRISELRHSVNKK